MSVRSVILKEMASVAQQQRKHLAPLTDNLPLLETGLDSLCLAILVASLDDELGLDPLSGDESPAFPVTLGEFIGVYEIAAADARA
jgi:hypothetical protein